MKKAKMALYLIMSIFLLVGCASQLAAESNLPTINLDFQYQLTFNEAEWVISVSPVIPSEYYFVQLTDEQISSVFYGLNISPSTASALFLGDDSFDSITAHDVSMRILIGVGHLHGNNMFADYDGTPIVSYVQGIPVRAFIVNTERERTSGAFFQTSFRLNDMSHNITLWNTDVTEGKKRLTEIANALIIYGMDLSIFSYDNDERHDVVPHLARLEG